MRFKSELERNITIKLGYANAKIFVCSLCPRPRRYQAHGSDLHKELLCQYCGKLLQLIRHVSFLDCPGHDVLMATMLNGLAIMDAAFLLVASNESCPQPQTSEHLAAAEIMKLERMVILQNKVDLITDGNARQHRDDILNLIEGTILDKAPVIPISAQLCYNIDVVCEYLATMVPVPRRDFLSIPEMIIIRSFDVNRPGAHILCTRGGIAGGSLVRGVLRLGEDIEISPGVVTKNEFGQISRSPLFSKITSLFAEKTPLKFAIPGGLVGVGTLVDPKISRGDHLVGQVLGKVGTLPTILIELDVDFFLLRRLLGVKVSRGHKPAKVEKIMINELIMVNVGSLCTGARVISVKMNSARLLLTNPVCVNSGRKLALSRRIDRHWRLIGWGNIEGGKTL